MLFIINEQFKKTTTGGKWLCRVFLVQYNWIYNECIDVTKRIGELWVWLKYYDWSNLTINYGSGTWFMRISELIKNHRWEDTVTQNVSIF